MNNLTDTSNLLGQNEGHNKEKRVEGSIENE
jgi:hypothetical protein